MLRLAVVYQAVKIPVSIAPLPYPVLEKQLASVRLYNRTAGCFNSRAIFKANKTSA